jgi:hypothetical protein
MADTEAASTEITEAMVDMDSKARMRHRKDRHLCRHMMVRSCQGMKAMASMDRRKTAILLQMITGEKEGAKAGAIGCKNRLEW